MKPLFTRYAIAERSRKQSDKKLAALRNTLEPMLQRELEHRGLDKANRGFEAKLIAWVEAAGSHRVEANQSLYTNLNTRAFRRRGSHMSFHPVPVCVIHASSAEQCS